MPKSGDVVANGKAVLGRVVEVFGNYAHLGDGIIYPIGEIKVVSLRELWAMGRQAHLNGEGFETHPCESWEEEGHAWLVGWWKREYELDSSSPLHKEEAIPTPAEVEYKMSRGW